MTKGNWYKSYAHMDCVMYGVNPKLIRISSVGIICQDDCTYWVNLFKWGVLANQECYSSWATLKKWLDENDLVEE